VGSGFVCAGGVIALFLAAAGPAVGVELLVTNSATDKVMRYDGNTKAYIDDFIPTGSGGLDAPRGILLGPDGNIYVASFNTDSVKKYDGLTGAYLGDFVTAGRGGLDGPEGMTWGPDGNLYVSSFNNDSVIRYQGPAGALPGALIDVFVPSQSGGLRGPRGLIFGNDQWTPTPPPLPAQDGYPELLVCSYVTGKVLWYNGRTGEYLGVYASLANTNNLIMERAIRYGELINGNLLVNNDQGVVFIFSGTFPQTGWGAFFNGPAHYPRGMAWGPDVNGDGWQDLYEANYLGSNIRIIGSNETDQGLFVQMASGDRPAYLAFKCGNRPPTLLRKISHARLRQGATDYLLLEGDNLAALTGVTLKKVRDGGATIPSTGLEMVGSQLKVTFDLAGAEGGRYHVVPNDSCGVANWLHETVLVYMPALTNGGFEEGWTPDREDVDVCYNPDQWSGGGGNKSKPKHWDIWINAGWEDQADIKRDGAVWHPCNGTGPHDPPYYPVGITGKHYGSIQANITGQGQISMFQTIAAPHVQDGMATADYAVYADCRVASFERLSWGYIRLIDGDEKGPTIMEALVPNTQDLDPYGLVRDEMFSAMVPAGYVYQSDPPTLTISLVLESMPGDICPEFECGYPLALKAFHVDNVRNSFEPGPACHTPGQDVDGDGDVDVTDFGVFQLCFNGSSQPWSEFPGSDDKCPCMDADGDGDVDVNDFATFQSCFNGPAQPPACAG